MSEPTEQPSAHRAAESASAVASADRADLRRLLSGSWPLVLINLAVTGMQFADSLMVAPLGEAALAAVFPAFMVYLIPVVFGHGMLGLVNTLTAQALGAGERSRCGRVAVQGLWLALGWGLLMLPLWFAAPLVFGWMGHAPEVQRLEIEYFRVLMFGAVPALMVAALSSFFTGLLRPAVLVFAAVAATGLNILFNWIFIYGNWGAPALGVAGAALGSVLATAVQALCLLAIFWVRPLREEFGTGAWKPDPVIFKQLVRTGAPAGLMPVFDLFTWGVVLVWMIGLFGTAHLAANTIVIRYLHLAFMPTFAFGATLTAMVGHSLGAGDPARAQRRAHVAFRVIAGYMGSVGLLFLLAREPLMRLFSSDPELIAAGAGFFVCAAIYQVFDAMYLTYSHALRGAGETVWPAAALLVLSCTVLVGGSWCLITFAPALQSLGPWIATTVYAACLGVAMAWRWRLGRWKQIRLT